MICEIPEIIWTVGIKALSGKDGEPIGAFLTQEDAARWCDKQPEEWRSAYWIIGIFLYNGTGVCAN
jgi:transposase